MNKKSLKLSVLTLSVASIMTSYADAPLPANVKSSKSPQPAPLITILAAPPHGRVRADSSNTGRFGDFRWRKNKQGQVHASFHEGIDIATGRNPLYAPWNGVTTHPPLSYSYHTVGTQNKEGGILEYMHTVNPAPANKPISVGQQVAVESNQGGNYPVHLHLQYNAPANEPLHAVWLGQRGQGGQFGTNATEGPYYGFGSKKSAINISQKPGRRIADPTPHLSFDVRFSGGADQRYSKYLGNTARQQFNALYGTNMPLNVPRYGSGAVATNLTPFPAVTKLGNWDQLSAGAANMSAVNGAVAADMSGYSLGGSYVSYQALASFIASDDGAAFGTLPPLAKPVDFTEMSMAEIVDQIGKHRYGNADWHKAVSKLSTKAMMTEYLMMTTESNFLKAANNRLKERIEVALAALAQARMHDYTKKVETLQMLASADAIPKIIDRELEASGDEYVTSYQYSNDPSTPLDIGNLPSDLNSLMTTLLEKVAGNESKGSYFSINRGGGSKNYNCNFSWTGSGPYQGKAIYDITNRSLSQIISQLSMKGANRCNEGAIWAAGKYQMVYVAAIDMRNRAPALWRKYANVPYSPQVQEAVGREWLLLTKRTDLANFILGKPGASLEAAKMAVAREWSSVGNPKTCTPKYCPSANADKGDKGYQHTQEVFAILAKIEQVNKQKQGK